MRTSLELLALAIICAAGMANSATVARGDEGELHAAVAGYVEAFNKQDLVVVTKMWMENASHVDRESGERTEGREAILADVAESFKSRPELRLTAHVDHVRLIRPDVACVEGQTSVVAPDEDPAVSNFLAILVKQDGAWRIDSIEEHRRTGWTVLIRGVAHEVSPHDLTTVEPTPWTEAGPHWIQVVPRSISGRRFDFDDHRQ